MLARVVDEELLAGVVDLAHRQAPAAERATIDLAEVGVTIPVGMLLEVLEVEQLQGDAGFAALGVQGGAVGPRPDAAPGHLAAAVQPPLERVVGQGLDLGPVEPGGAGAQHRRPHGPAADPQALGDRPVAAAQGEPLTKNLPCVSHGQSLGGHSSPFEMDGAFDRPAPLRSGHPPPGGCPAGRVITGADPGDHDAPIWVVTMGRNAHAECLALNLEVPLHPTTMTTLGLHRAEGFATADAVCPQCRRFIRVIKAEKDVECRPGCVQPLTLLQRRRPPNPRCASRPKMLANPLRPHAANDRHGVSRPAIRHTHLVHSSTVIHRYQSCSAWCGLAGRVAKSDGLVVHREHRHNNSPIRRGRAHLEAHA